MKNILYVHDDQVDPKPRQESLELAGYHVTAMQDALRCLYMVENSPPDLIVCDTLLHGMTGFELCAAIRELLPAESLPLILCSSIYRGSAYVNEAERLGAQHFMMHPMDLEEFIDNVNKLLPDSDSQDTVAA